MRPAYFVVAIAQIMSGILSMILSSDLFRGYGGDVGLIPISTGLLHLLNWEYGGVTRGFRYSALLAGLLATALALWQALPTVRWEEAVVVALCPLALLLSFSVWPRFNSREVRGIAS